MIEKRTKLLRIEHQSKFTMLKNAVKEANAIQNFVKRTVIRKQWACKILIAVSENDLRVSKPVLVRNGKRGRPIKKYISKYTNRTLRKTKSHLHIILYGYPAQTIANEIVNNINKRHRKRCDNKKVVVSRSWKCNRGYIPYVINQITSVRQVNYDPTGILCDLDFDEEYKKRKPEMF